MAKNELTAEERANHPLLTVGTTFGYETEARWSGPTAHDQIEKQWLACTITDVAMHNVSYRVDRVLRTDNPLPGSEGHMRAGSTGGFAVEYIDDFLANCYEIHKPKADSGEELLDFFRNDLEGEL